MARSVSARESAPFSAINMTPFIDILLVLLIMLIITVPMTTHKLAVDLPAPSDKPVPLIPPQTLALDAAGNLYWNGERIADERLPGLARATAEADVPLAIRPDPLTKYERFNHALAVVRREGVAKLGFTSPQGIEKVIEIIRPGQTFGEALMFLEQPYIVFAQALADSMLLHVSKNVVFDELARGPGFGRRMLSGLSRRLHGLVRDVEAYTLRSGQERLIGYLLAEAPEATDGKPVEVQLSAGKGVIASRLNMTPEHFSRILHELAASGLIEVNGRSVRIPDLARLRNGA